MVWWSYGASLVAVAAVVLLSLWTFLLRRAHAKFPRRYFLLATAAMCAMVFAVVGKFYSIYIAHGTDYLLDVLRLRHHVDTSDWILAATLYETFLILAFIASVLLVAKRFLSD